MDDDAVDVGAKALVQLGQGVAYPLGKARHEPAPS